MTQMITFKTARGITQTLGPYPTDVNPDLSVRAIAERKALEDGVTLVQVWSLEASVETERKTKWSDIE